MTAIRKCRFLWLGTLGVATWMGCASPGFSPWKTASLGNSSDGQADAAGQPHGELPPKEAARACLAAAEELQNSGHGEQAIPLYEKARRNDPSLKSVAHRLAVLYDAQGDGARSLCEYNKALESEPKNPGLLSDLGYYYYERGNRAEAERSLRKALAIDPSHQKALCNLGLVLAAEGRFDESFEVFAKAVGPAAAHSNVGVLMAKQGRYEQAGQAFHQALAMDATLPQPKAFLAYLDRQPPDRQ
ncbi:MAG: tetratricopeptide repeat protein [Thermoguttaceae bacterium]|jgi:Flp pilus assembly protein TadD